MIRTVRKKYKKKQEEKRRERGARMGCTHSVLPDRSGQVSFTAVSSDTATTVAVDVASSALSGITAQEMIAVLNTTTKMDTAAATDKAIDTTDAVTPSINAIESVPTTNSLIESNVAETITIDDIASGHMIDKSTGLQYKEAVFNSKNIFTAIKRGDEIVVGLLLKENPNLIYEIGMWGSTPLIAALQYNYENISNMIIDYLIINREFNNFTSSDIINRRNDKGATALLYACMWGHTNIVKRLIEHGALISIEPSLAMHNINKDCLDIYTPLSIAITNDFLDVVKILVYYSDQIELMSTAKEEEQRGPESTSGDNISVLYDLSINNRISLYDTFPFAMNGPYAVSNNTLNKRTYNGLNPLLLAAFIGSFTIVQYIVDLCNDFSELCFVDCNSNNILHYITMIPSEDTSRKILDYLMNNEIIKKILVNECSRYDSNGFLPLHLAVTNKHIIITELLLVLNSQVVNNNATNKTGYSCLHISIRKKSSDLVKLLLKFNANPLLCDASGTSCEALVLKLNKDSDIYVQVINAITLIKSKVDGIEAGLSVSPSYQQLIIPNGDVLQPTVPPVSNTENIGSVQQDYQIPLSSSKFPISPSDIAPTVRTPLIHRIR